LALETGRLFDLDRILLIPAQTSPHKQDQFTTDIEHRLRMLELAVNGHPLLEVSTLEKDRGGISYTIDTVETLSRQHPKSDLYLIMGIDTFRGMPTWRDARRILENCHLLVSTRPGYSPQEMETTLATFQEKLPEVDYQLRPSSDKHKTYCWSQAGRTMTFYSIAALDISSTRIRADVSRGISAKKELPPEVEGYIISHRLYKIPPHSHT